MLPPTSKKDGVESSRGSLKNGAEMLVLFLHGAHLVLKSGILPHSARSK